MYILIILNLVKQEVSGYRALLFLLMHSMTFKIVGSDSYVLIVG